MTRNVVFGGVHRAQKCKQERTFAQLVSGLSALVEEAFGQTIALLLGRCVVEREPTRSVVCNLIFFEVFYNCMVEQSAIERGGAVTDNTRRDNNRDQGKVIGKPFYQLH